MSELRFYARGDLLAYVPNHVGVVGQAPRYIGRTLVSGTKTAPSSYPANEVPHVFVDASASDVARLASFCRDGSIWPADKETAAACGVSFTPVEFKDGGWIAKSKSVTKEPSK